MRQRFLDPYLAISMPSPTAFQIVSIEPTQSFKEIVNAAAGKYCLSADFDDSRMFNAPVCGIQYHVQRIQLSDCSGSLGVTGRMEDCLAEIENFVDLMVADGYIELLQD